MPSRPSDTMPSTMKLTMTIVAKTGRLIDVSEIHMTIEPQIPRTFAPSASWPPRVREHDVAGGEAFDDLDTGAIGEALGHFDRRSPCRRRLS